MVSSHLFDNQIVIFLFARDAMKLEEKCAALLNCLVSVDSRTIVCSHLSTADLQRMFTSVTSHLVMHGVQKTTTSAVKMALAVLLRHLLKKLPAVILRDVCGSLLEQLAVILVSLIGGESDDLQVGSLIA